MPRFLSTLLSSLLLCASLLGAPITFVWDVPDKEQVAAIEGYRLYTKIDSKTGPIYLLQGTVLGAQYKWTGECSPGQTWILRAFNIDGESPDSESVKIPLAPLAPPGFKRIKVSVQSSKDLKVWEEHGTLMLANTGKDQYFRLQVDPVILK